MNFKEPLIAASENMFYLAPIPVFKKQYDDHDLHQRVYDYGFENLTPFQKLMGQELPQQYDTERQKTYVPWQHNEDQWVENTEHNPIGSRFSVPPNNFLDIDTEDIKTIRNRIVESFFKTLNELEIKHNNEAIITESWIQYYDPYSGRGHNQHNHCRWQASEEPEVGFSGGYYLSDGDPLKDHPYSGVFCFHLRGATHFIRPHRGMLMLWPNDIVHSVKPFYGKTHRCVINFNIQLP